MKEHTIVYPYNEILLSNKKEWTIDTCNNTDKSQNNYAEWKKPGQKKHIQHYSLLYMTRENEMKLIMGTKIIPYFKTKKNKSLII